MSTKQTTNISLEEYKSLRAKYDKYFAARAELVGTRNYTTPDDEKLLPPCPTSDETSMIEVWEFRHDKPEKYFSYVSDDKKFVITWTGEILGAITYYNEWHDNFGGTRASIRVRAINGCKYAGTFYKSSGDYCRLKRVK